MGRISVPKYRLEKLDNFRKWDRCAWRGRPSRARLEKDLAAWNKSLVPGGANEHLIRDLGLGFCWVAARVVRQSDGAVMATVRVRYWEAQRQAGVDVPADIDLDCPFLILPPEAFPKYDFKKPKPTMYPAKPTMSRVDSGLGLVPFGRRAREAAE